MLSYEFILVFALLLGSVTILLQPVWEQEDKWENQKEEWEKETRMEECQSSKRLAEIRAIVWKNTCDGIETLAGWDANHYA